MQISIVVNGVCDGGSHVTMTATVGQQSRVLTYRKSDFAFDPSDFEEVKEVIAHLIRSRVKTAGATTNQQIKTAIESAPFIL